MLLALCCIIPLWYVFIQSLSSNISGKNFFLPDGFTLSNYAKVFKMGDVVHATYISVARTLIGTAATVMACMLLGYLFTREDMPLRKLLYSVYHALTYYSNSKYSSFHAMKE